MKDLTGIFTALVTPFKDGQIDWNSLRRLIRFQLDNGVNGFVINGTTAESPTLSNEERKQLFDFAKTEVSGQVPLVMGTGSNSTGDTIALTQSAEKWGADAALVVVPYYNKPPQRGLFQHFQKVAESTSIPVILYNVPSRTITKLEWDTIVELSQIQNIVGIKEASGDIGFGKKIIDASGPGFFVTSGDDGTYLELIGVGGKGAISVGSHILPKQFSEWCARARKGDVETRQEFSRYSDLNNYLYVEANPIPIKMALHFMGLIDSPELRLPLTKLAEPYAVELRKKMQAVELL